MEETKAQGLLIGKGGLYGNVLRIAPPLSLTLDEAAEGLDILVKAIDSVQAASCMTAPDDHALARRRPLGRAPASAG